jgi:hypothetical protein
MLHSLCILAAGGGEPLIPSNPALDAFKHFVNRSSVPEISLPLFVLLFVAMMKFYRQWTKPLMALMLTGLFCLAYFGSMLIDYNYFLIIAKPDNIPITMMLGGTGLCLWVAFRQAALNDAALEAGRPLQAENKDDKVLVWPDLVYSELIALVLASVVLIVWAILFRAPLESPANPAGPPNPSKAPWYFLGLQEMLVYFDPWMAGVVLPTMILTGLIGMPYMDVNPRGNGYYTLKQRPFAMWTWLAGFLILWVVLIVYGTFLRGPNWNFFGPYEYWDSHIQVPLTNVNLSDYFWVFLLKQPLPASPLVRELVGIVFTAVWMGVLPVALGFVGMRRMREQMGWFRFLYMSVHLVVMALLPVKMVLRWLANLKYFVYLPEYNLNL